MALSALERRVADDIARGREELVELVSTLVGFDTTTHALGAPAREEAALQEHLAERLRGAGAEIDLWEPQPDDLPSSPMVPEGLRFDGRPQLAARFRGAGGGGGRSLLLNGHVDVVAAEPREAWTSDPRRAALRDGLLYGRGTCDMKGGVACMVFAAEALAAAGVRLRGDLVVNTVTEEESTGAGGVAAVARGLRADGAIVPEPSGLDVFVACRGSLLPTIHVDGRAGHAGIPAAHFSEGGAVNAIEKMGVVLDAVARLREEWRLRTRHRYLSPAEVVPTIISGGEWIVSYPAACRLDCHIEYLPGQADPDGFGRAVEREFADWIARAARADPWLAEHPPRVTWEVGGVPAAEVSEDEPVVQALLAAARDVGIRSRPAGMENWHDGATFTLTAGTPAICFGPGQIHVAHTVDEHVPVDDLVACAQGIAVAALRFCGVA